MWFDRLFLNIGEKIDGVNDQIRVDIKREEADRIYEKGMALYDEAIEDFAKEFNDSWEKQKGEKSEMGSIIKSGIRQKFKQKLETTFNHKFEE